MTGESYSDLQYLGSVHDSDLKDHGSDGSYPVHIRNHLNPQVCRIYMSDDTFKFTTDDDKTYKIKLKDVQHERVDHKNKILTVVARMPKEYSYSVHYFFSFVSVKSKLDLYQPLQILEVSFFQVCFL